MRIGTWNLQGRLGLQVPTAEEPHQIDGVLSIDHIAVPRIRRVLAVEHHPAVRDGARISDHDAYVIEIAEAGPYASAGG